MENILLTEYYSPVGKLVIGVFNNKICMCDWAESKRHITNKRNISRKLNADFEEGHSEIIDDAIIELVEYFVGERSDFSVPLTSIGTEFQRRVWAELMKIPCGTTISYSELARRIGNPNAVRAVASAVAANPISILVPCHRVVGSDGSLTGYAGGVAAKKVLHFIEKNPIK